MNAKKSLLDHVFFDGMDEDKAAYNFQNKNLSYGNIFLNVRRFSQAMKELELKKNDRVLLFLNDTPAFVYCFLAAVQVGAIPIPLNPKSKSLYLEHYMVDSSASLIVCEKENRQFIYEAAVNVGLNVPVIIQDIFLNRDVVNGSDTVFGVENILLSQFDSLPEYKSCDFSSDKVVFFQYTSGTTGLPKAVIHTLDGVLHSNEVYAKGVLNINKNSFLYSTAKLFFGYGLGNSLLFNLLNGATALLDERWPNEMHILNNMRKSPITHFFSVPKIYSDLLDNSEEIVGIKDAEKIFISAGAPLPESIFVSWRERFNIEILNGVGATEVGHIFLSNLPGKAKPETSGVLLPGYEAKLISGEDGVIGGLGKERGELYIKGPSVSPGYYNKPEKNLESFSGGWYKTGDVFLKNEFSEYTYIGRNNDIFKLKGRWVVPKNLEDFLIKNFTWLDEVAIVSSNDEEPKLVMCFVEKTSETTKYCVKKEVYDYVGSVFEGHYCPQEFRRMCKFPRNDNGKLERHKLLEEHAEIIQ